MSQIEYSQTLGQQEHIEYLLTVESMRKWRSNLSQDKWDEFDRSGLTSREFYLKEHGLPLSSEIKGL